MTTDVSDSMCHDKAIMDSATAQHQQQRMISMLQLCIDELSAQNGKLRLQMARADRQLPRQLQNDYMHTNVNDSVGCIGMACKSLLPVCNYNHNTVPRCTFVLPHGDITSQWESAR